MLGAQLAPTATANRHPPFLETDTRGQGPHGVADPDAAVAAAAAGVDVREGLAHQSSGCLSLAADVSAVVIFVE